MPLPLTALELIAQLKSRAIALGVEITSEDSGGLAGEIEAIKSKWWFGGRKAVYRMSCHLDGGSCAVMFREAASETSWGLPPPSVKVERESVSGWQRTSTRKETAVGGGGALDFGRVRSALANVVKDAGWQFRLEVGQMP